MARPEYLFAYGTLLTGTPVPQLQRIIQRGFRSLGRAWTRGRLYDLGNYPGMVPDDAGDSRVYGVLFRVKHPGVIASALDRYEGYDPKRAEHCEFVRDLRSVYLLPKDEQVNAWVYAYRGNTAYRPPIGDGDYVRYLKRR